MANITDDPPPISIRSGAIADPLLEAFARRLMARELGDRFSSARAALDMLELIERDRDAAMQRFGLLPHAPVAAAEAAPAITQRDTVATVVFSGSAVRRSARRGEVSAVRKPDSTRRWAIVGGMAVALIASVIGLAAPRAIVAEPPALELPVAAAEQGMSIRATRTEPPPPAAQVREIPRAPRRIATAAVMPRPRTAAGAAPAPAPAAQSAAEVALIDPGAAEVARRYVAVGQALTRATDVDELWVTYRWIRLNDALATSVGRQAALRAIEHIERDLAGRAP